MKILLLTHDFPPKLGGIASYSLELACSLAKSGQEVIVIAPQSAKRDAEGNTWPFIVLRVRPIFSPFYVFQYIFFLERFLRAHPDAKILCSNWYPWGLAVWLSPSRIRGKVTYYLSAHGAEFLEKNGSFLKRWLRRQVLKRAEGIFSVSRFTATKVQALLHKEGKIKIIPNGVNTEKFFPIPQTITRNLPLLFTVCRLEPNKGVDTALKALAILAKKNRSFEYWIAGAGADLGRLEKMRDELGLSQQVRFLGVVSEAKLRELYSLCDIFLLLSREEEGRVEGFGLVFLEAAACGKTAVATNVGGIPDAVIDGKTGLLVPPDNPEKSAEAIEYLLDHVEEREQMAQLAMNRVHTEMSWNSVAKRMSAEMEQYG